MSSMLRAEPETQMSEELAVTPSDASAPAPQVNRLAVYLCPMHPQIRQSSPGSCPICGMSLEPESVSPQAATVPQWSHLHERLGLAMVLAIPLMALSMREHASLAIECLLATPVVFWCGWPFLSLAIASVRSRNLNMFTLIGLGVITSYSYSLLAMIIGNDLPVYFESAAVITALALLGQFMETKTRNQANKALRALFELSPKTAHLVSAGGHDADIAISDVKVGDLLRIRPGEKIPVDGVVTEGESDVEEAMVTGESMPAEKKVGNQLIAATMNGSGTMVMRAEHVGSDTMLARIVELISKAQRTRAPIQNIADTVCSYFVPAVLAISVITAIGWLIFGPEPKLAHALMSAVSVLVIACPCALGLATPMSIMAAAERGARAGVLIRDANTLQMLETADTLVVDKTGTLTEGTPQLLAIFPSEGYTETNVLRMAASLEHGSEHPLGQAIVRAAEKKGLGFLEVHAFKAIAGKGVTAIIEGRSVALGNALLLDSLGVPSALKTKAEPYKSQGQSVVFLSVDGHPAALFTISDPVKETTPEALKQFKQLGLRVVMLTGDNRTTALAVARRLGIDEVKSEMLPEHKAEFIRQLQESGRKVIMAGDGVNDAPALATARIGIAMGSGADLAMENAGITLMHGDLMGIVRARRLSVLTMKNIRQNLAFAFIYNGIGIVLATGMFYPLLGITLSPMVASAAMALSSVSVIVNSLRLRNAVL